LMQN